MKEALISRFIELTSAIGLNYEFLNSGYELDMWLNGMVTTLKLVAITIPLSLFFGVMFAGALTSGKRWLAVPVRGYVELTRNTPTLVQLMCGFLVLNMLISNAIGGAQNNPLTPFFWLVAVTGLHIAALHAEALRGGIEAVPGTTIEAARAIGFNSFQVLIYVELPLAIRTFFCSSASSTSSWHALATGLKSVLQFRDMANEHCCCTKAGHLAVARDPHIHDHHSGHGTLVLS